MSARRISPCAQGMHVKHDEMQLVAGEPYAWSRRHLRISSALCAMEIPPMTAQTVSDSLSPLAICTASDRTVRGRQSSSPLVRVILNMVRNSEQLQVILIDRHVSEAHST